MLHLCHSTHVEAKELLWDLGTELESFSLSSKYQL